MHNTLAASDYGLLDENSYTPRPNYWAALLWHKLMAETVLDPGSSPALSLHIFAQCLRNHPGGVALLVINASHDAEQKLVLPTAFDRYTLTAEQIQDTRVLLNGVELQLGANDALPELNGTRGQRGTVTFAPVSITFLALANAHNASCQ